MNPAAGSLVAAADVAVPRAAAPVSPAGAIFSAAPPGAAFATPAPVTSGVPGVLALSSGLLALTGIAAPLDGAPAPVPPAGNPLQTALLGLGARRGTVTAAAAVAPGQSASATGLIVNPAVGGVGPVVPRQGPVAAALRALFREIRYQLFDLRPTATPSQLQGTTSPEEGTLNVWDADGDPVTFTVTAAPEHGTVNVDADGFYIFTPDAGLARTGGTDSFTVRVADAGVHLQTLFGLPAHSTTVTVPVTVARPLFGLDNSAPVYTLHNTSQVAVQIAGYTVNGSTVYPKVGTVLSPAGTDGDNAVFEIPDGAQVTVSLNPVGVTHYGVVQAITAGGGFNTPTELAVSADGVNAYVASGADVLVIDTAIGTVTTAIPIVANWDGGNSINDVAVSPDGTRVYASSSIGYGASSDSTVSVIDTRPASPAYNQVISTIDLGNDFANRLAVSPDGARVYVVGDSTVSVIDTTTNTVVGSPITVGSKPYTVAVSRDGARVYVVNYGDGTVSVIDTTTNTVVGSPISVGVRPFVAAISPDGAHLYVIDGGDVPADYNYPSPDQAFQGKVWVIDTATDTVVGSPTAFGTTVPTYDGFRVGGSVVSPDGKHLYVGNQYVNKDLQDPLYLGFVSVIDINPASLTYNTEIDTIDTGVDTTDVAVSADGRLYALSYNSDILQVLNLDRAGSDGGSAQYTLTLGASEGCSSANGALCKVSGNDAYLLDAPGTVVTVPISNAQRQSDTLGNLCVKTDSNCTFAYDATKGSSKGFSNPTFPEGFTIYSNLTSSPSTSQYQVSTTATTTNSWQYALNVSTSVGFKFTDWLNATVSGSYTTTTGNTVANSQTFTQSVTATVEPGETLFVYLATPVSRFYGDWTVRYGNTTYALKDVWFDSPITTGTAQIAAYTCTTGSQKCADLQHGKPPTDSAGNPLGFEPSIYGTTKV
ncbi:MAG: Ig-like domain-containing protein [Mycobacteriaceae bacterium]